MTEEEKIQALKDRWIGQEKRINKIKKDAMKTPWWIDPAQKVPPVDWIVHLEGLPSIDEVSKEGPNYGKDLRGIPLSGRDLKNINLTFANLQYAILFNSNLQNAYLRNANLQKANLVSAKLQDAKLSSADLQNAHLLCAQLQKAELVGVHLQYAILYNANLQNTDLWSANLQNADLRGADFTNAILKKVDLRGVILDSDTNFGFNKVSSVFQFRDMSRFMLRDEYKALEYERIFDFEEAKKQYSVAQNIYRQLKKAYKDQGMYHEASRFYYREQVCRRKSEYPTNLIESFHALLEIFFIPFLFIAFLLCIIFDSGSFKDNFQLIKKQIRGNFSLLFSVILPRFLNFFFKDFLFRYGESPYIMLILHIPMVIFGSAWVYFLNGVGIVEKNVGWIQEFFQSLYFSIIIFTTLGFSDYNAGNANLFFKFWIAGEALMGVLLTSLLLIAFARISIRD